MRNSLSQHLNESIKHNEPINESLVLGAIVATACLTYAVGPVLNTEFMKSVGSGLGGLLGGIGSLFGGFGGFGSTKLDDIKEILKKDPDDMTGKEKELLKKVAKNPKLQKELSNNEIKKINKAIGSSSDREDTDIPNDELKDIHALLKKKPGDLSPKEKAKLKEYSEKYDLTNELSDTELKNFKAATGADLNNPEETPNEETPTETPAGFTEGLLALAAAANKNEEDSDKKAENDALIDLVTASCYDEDGNSVKPEDREKRLKDLVGEDNWDDFKKDLEEKKKSVKEEDFAEALKKAKKDLTPETAQQMLDEQKERAKTANDKIKKDKEERQALEDELKELEKDPEANKDKIDELKKKREDLIKGSLLGKASPSAAKSAIERTNKGTGTGEPNPDPKPDPKPESKKDKVRKEQDKEIEAINKKHLEEFDKLQNEYAGKMRDAKSDDERKDLEKELQDKTKELQDKTKADLDDIENLGEEYQTELDKAFADYTEKSNKELEDFTEKTKDMDVNSDEYKEAQKEYDNKIKKLESDRDTTIEDAVEKAWGKKKNDLDDKEGKYTEKEEEVTDPETGKKIKVTTFTGPRGGKFYYPKGKPKKPENKVYVSESFMSLKDRLLNCIFEHKRNSLKSTIIKQVR